MQVLVRDKQEDLTHNLTQSTVHRLDNFDPNCAPRKRPVLRLECQHTTPLITGVEINRNPREPEPGTNGIT